MRPNVKRLIVLLLVAAFLLGTARVSPMEMHVEGDRLIITGPLSGLELSQFSSALTPNVKTIVLKDSGGGDFPAGVNLAEMIRYKKLNTVAQGRCVSSCANAFLGGVERRLANRASYVGFHGHYNSVSDRPLLDRTGEMRRFYDEMTGGKVNDDLVQRWMMKQRRGLVYFYRSVTYSCNGDEPKRPTGCEKLPQTALEQGIITSLDDVEVNQAALNDFPLTSERGRTEYERYLEATLPKAFAISPDKSHFAWRSTAQGTTEATNQALARCAELAGEPCLPYAVDDDVV